MDRRDFVKTLSIVGASTLSGKGLRAEETSAEKEFFGVLVDTTKCIGCRRCEVACANENGLPRVDDLSDSVFKKRRPTTITQWTVINHYKTETEGVFVKDQCMHCNQPACAAACLTKALLKTEEGPIIWREDKCMGCRFCMISCPFEIPKFEYHSAIPKIQKCMMCWERLQEGKQLACVEICPVEALLYGSRRDLIKIARKRIVEKPDLYINQIFGENDAGGTGWLYLSSLPFEQLGFRTDLGTTPYPEYTQDYLYAVPIILALWPAFLLALSNATKREEESEV